MNRAELILNRILFASDTMQRGEEALHAAAELASQLQAELVGLFIEDTNLLRLAGLPFAQEICTSSAAQRPLDLASMERAMREQASQMREAVASIAKRRNVPWSFGIRRGSVIHVTLAASEDADLLILGRRDLHRLTSPAKRGALSNKQPILVVYDGSSGGQRALETGEFLANQREVDLIVVISDHQADRRRLLDETRPLPGHRHLRVVVTPDSINDIKQLIDAAGSRHCGLVLINRDHRLLDADAAGQLLKGLECPLGVVR
jgi:nucleotide-binding universal stress UspA family protein